MRRLLIVLTALLMLLGVSGAAMARPDAGKGNPNSGSQEPGCKPSGNQPKKCGESDTGPGNTGNPRGNCANGVDDDQDGKIDSADPECQQPGCRPSNNTPNKCNETTPRCATQGGDPDGDGVCTNTDNCPDDYNRSQTDADGDGVGNACDNCPTTSNANQADTNRDGIGDACQPADSHPCGDEDGGLAGAAIADQIWHGADGALPSPLFEDPHPDGAVSGLVYEGARDNGAGPALPLFLEAACAVDLFIDSSAGGDL